MGRLGSGEPSLHSSARSPDAASLLFNNQINTAHSAAGGGSATSGAPATAHPPPVRPFWQAESGESALGLAGSMTIVLYVEPSILHLLCKRLHKLLTRRRLVCFPSLFAIRSMRNPLHAQAATYGHPQAHSRLQRPSSRVLPRKPRR
jgi:hypothetical protein